MRHYYIAYGNLILEGPPHTAPQELHTCTERGDELAQDSAGCASPPTLPPLGLQIPLCVVSTRSVTKARCSERERELPPRCLQPGPQQQQRQNPPTTNHRGKWTSPGMASYPTYPAGPMLRVPPIHTSRGMPTSRGARTPC